MREWVTSSMRTRDRCSSSFVSMPAGMNHFAWATTETIVQVHGNGPFAIVYVNPADDPSKGP